MRVAIAGASGYTGLELIRLVGRHPQLELVAITSEQRAGMAAGDAFPALRGGVDLAFESLDAASLAERVDVAFLCLPHGMSATVVGPLRAAGVRVIDLGGDFRLRNMDDYIRWYGEHKAPELFGTAVYGIPELYRAELAGAPLAAAAGCYPTSALLPLLPFLREGRIETDGIVVDAKSGVSGAGRTLDEGYLFAELEGSPRAYKVGGVHRHVPEIEQEASLTAGAPIRLSFIPHLLPITRGMLTSVITRPRQALSTADALAVLDAAYRDEPFVRVLPEGEFPSVAAVRGTNFCDVTAVSDERAGTLLLLSSLDNLVKGASGQMVQCLNAMAGLEETEGLGLEPWLP